MKTRVLKFVRKNLEEYDRIWVVRKGVKNPIKAAYICQLLNNRRYYTTQINAILKAIQNYEQRCGKE